MVYPRVCGGAGFKLNRNDLRQGLSPRVRGSQEHRTSMVLSPRSIPACAGEPGYKHGSG